MRVVEHKAFAQQAGVVVEDAAVEQPQAARIDEHLRAVRPLENRIAVLRRALPTEDVLEAGTAACLDADTEPRFATPALGQHRSDVCRGVSSDLNHERDGLL